MSLSIFAPLSKLSPEKLARAEKAADVVVREVSGRLGACAKDRLVRPGSDNPFYLGRNFHRSLE